MAALVGAGAAGLTLSKEINVPRKKNFPKWVDCDNATLDFDLDHVSSYSGAVMMTIDGEPLFLLTRDDAKDIAAELIAWANGEYEC